MKMKKCIIIVLCLFAPLFIYIYILQKKFSNEPPYILGEILIVLLVVFLIYAFGKKISGEPLVTLAEIPILVDLLQNTGSDGSFVLFLFPEEIVSNGISPGLQFSIEKKKIGIDYLLNSQFNKREKDKFIEIVSEMGYKYEKREGNGVEYIRIEGDFLVKNGQELLRRIYGVKNNYEIHSVIRGFNYKKGSK